MDRTKGMSMGGRSFAGRRRLLAAVVIAVAGFIWPDAGKSLAADPVSGLSQRPANTTCLAGAAPPSGAVQLQRVWPELAAVAPFDLRLTPDKSAYYVISRQGKMYRFVPGQAPVLALDITAEIGLNTQANAYTDPPVGSENWGLVSLAFDPGFAQNGRVFVLYNGRKSGDPYTVSTVARYSLKPDRTAFDPASGLVVIRQPQPNGNVHHFGHLTFGPDGFLYIGSGDGTLNGPTYFPQVPAQKLNDLRGKILRLDVSSGTATAPYSIPADNPWKGVAGAKPEIWALGVRNPWRFSFDSFTGELWVGDVGQAQLEEVSIVPRGGNMGWNAFEGSQCRTDYPGPGSCTSLAVVPPVAEISHGGNYMSVTGGMVYRGTALPGLVGKYVFALYGPQALYTVSRDASTYTTARLADVPGGIASFFTDAQQELYGIDPWAGAIYKLVPGAGSVDAGVPQLLSQTGCVQPGNTKAARGMIPFTVKSALWSDGATKSRWLALPDGETIDILADGDFEFPVGAVLMKRFQFNYKPFETRLLKRHTDGTWAGYSYQWNADGKDATLVPSGGRTIQVVNNGGKTIDWRLPSRGECLVCHTRAAKDTIGPEIAQINGAFKYPTTGITANQLVTWDHIGLFRGPLPAPVETLPSLANYDDTTLPVTARARSYLHANCAACHRPGNPIRATMDLRFQAATPDMKVCNAKPNIGDLGIVGAKLLYPGRPDLSILRERIRIRGDNQMPPLGSGIVHPMGVNVVSNWIRSPGVCN